MSAECRIHGCDLVGIPGECRECELERELADARREAAQSEAVCVRLQDALREAQRLLDTVHRRDEAWHDAADDWYRDVRKLAALRVFEEDAPETESSEAPLSGRGEEQT